MNASTKIPMGHVPDETPWEILLALGVEKAFPGMRCVVVRNGGQKFAMHLEYTVKGRKVPVPPSVRKRATAFMHGFLLAETGGYYA